jgi:hypothetical protein
VELGEHLQARALISNSLNPLTTNPGWFDDLKTTPKPPAYIKVPSRNISHAKQRHGVVSAIEVAIGAAIFA